MKNNTENLKACLLVTLSAILYGFLGYFGTKVLEGNLSTSNMLFWRFFLSGIWMMIFVIRRKNIHAFFKIEKKILWITLLTSIGYAGSSGFFFIAVEDTGTGIAMVIFFAYPMMVALYSWMAQKSSFNIKTFVVLLIMLLGLYLIKGSSTMEGEELAISGILFAIAAALSYAFYITGSKKYGSNLIDSNILTVLVSAGCALLFLILAISNNTFTFPTSLQTWMYLIALAILATAIPIQLMLEGLKHVSSIRASILSVFEPLVTIFVGVILLNESMSIIQILGAGIIMGSSLLIQFQKEL